MANTAPPRKRKPAKKKPIARKRASARKAAAPRKKNAESSKVESSSVESRPVEIRPGPKTLYRTEYAAIASAMCKIGATVADLAEEFGVSFNTIGNWIGKYPEFAEAVKIAKCAYDDRVERSLATRAIGYEYGSEKVFCFQGQVITHRTREHVPADPGAAKVWLTNRRRSEWSDTSKHEMSGPDGGAIEVVEKHDELEVARRVAFMLARAGNNAKVIEHSE